MAHLQESLIILAASVTGSSGNVTVTGLDATNSYVLPTVTPGDTFYYSILTDGAGNWEYGSGTWVSTGNGTTTFGTFARTAPIKSKAGVATPANFSGAPVTMIFDVPAEKALFLDPSNNIVNGEFVANAVNSLDFASLVAKKVPTVSNVVFRVAYGRTEGDGLGGFFIWKSGDATPAQDHTTATTVNVIAPAVGSGRYHRVFEAFVPASVAADTNIPTGGIAAITGTDELRRQRATVGAKSIPQVESYHQAEYPTFAAWKAVASSKWRNGDTFVFRGITVENDLGGERLTYKWDSSNTDTAALDVITIRPDDITGSNPGRAVIVEPVTIPKFTNSDATPSLKGGKYHRIADTVPALITALDDMIDLRVYYIFPGAQDQIFQHGAALLCPEAANFTLRTTDSPIQAVSDNGVVTLIVGNSGASILATQVFS